MKFKHTHFKGVAISKDWFIDVEGVCHCPFCGKQLKQVPWESKVELATHSLECPKCKSQFILELTRVETIGNHTVDVSRKRTCRFEV